MNGRWVLHPLEGRYAIRDLTTDQLLRGWRKGQRKLIWRGTQVEAEALITTLSVKGPPREELDKTQRIHYANRAKYKRSTKISAPAFTKCPGCAKMVKPTHQCGEAK